MLLIKLSSVDSTSTFLKQWVQQTKDNNAIGVWAEHQTHGRGRMGTNWLSEKGLNLTASVYLGDILFKNDAVFEINKRVCLAVLDALTTLKTPELKIKWPNDILAGNKKIGGILVEPMLRGSQVTEVIIGFGINVNQTEFSTLPCATSLRNITGEINTIEPLFEAVTKNIEHAIRADKTDNKRYLEYLYGLNESCAFERNDGTPFWATITDVDKHGKLILTHSNGAQESFEEKTLVFTAFARCQ